MATGFFIGLKNGFGEFMDEAGQVLRVPANRVPRKLQPGQDFKYRANSKGDNIHIAEPVSARAQASNSPRDRQQFAIKHLISKGWTAPQASGIVGRFMVEAYPDLRTNAVGDKDIPGASHGIGQWNRERKAAMIAYTTGRNPGGRYADHPLVLAALEASPGSRSKNDLGAQLDYFDWELRNSPSERIAYNTIRRAKNPIDAAAGMMHYERPRGYTSSSPTRGMHWSRTAKNAAHVMRAYDPNYDAKVDLVASPHDVDRANAATNNELGDMGTAEAIARGEGFSEDDSLNQVLGLDDDVSDQTDDEDTLGGAISSAAEDYGTETEGVDTSDSHAFIQEMIRQGQEASAGSLPRLPNLNEVLGEV